LTAEIDRAVIDLVRHGLGEGRVLGHVVAAADHFHGEPRHAQLLVAAGIDLGEFGDGRHLAQEAERIEAPLLQRAGRPRELRGPADLAFDFADELPDLAGRSLGLLALNADQRGLLLLISEVDVEGAVGDEREADDGDEQSNVFDEQAAAHNRRAGGRSEPGQAARQPPKSSAAMIRQRSHASSWPGLSRPSRFWTLGACDSSMYTFLQAAPAARSMSASRAISFAPGVTFMTTLQRRS